MTVGKKSRRRRMRGRALLVAGSIAVASLTGCEEEADDGQAQEPTEAEEEVTDEDESIPVGNLVAPQPLPPPDTTAEDPSNEPAETIGGSDTTPQVADPETEEVPE